MEEVLLKDKDILHRRFSERTYYTIFPLLRKKKKKLESKYDKIMIKKALDKYIDF